MCYYTYMNKYSYMYNNEVNSMENQESLKNQSLTETCATTIIHQDLILRAEDNMPPEETLYDLAELFKIFGDSTRVRIHFRPRP